MGRLFHLNRTLESKPTRRLLARTYPRTRRFIAWVLGGAVMAVGFAQPSSMAQEVVLSEGAARTGVAVAQPSGTAAAPQAKPAQEPGKEGAQAKPEEKKEGEAKAEEKAKEGEAAAQAVTRPDKPSFSPDPAELEIQPDEDGNIQFSFHGQSWPDVLNWLAGVSGLSLDWQKMPGDYLNLTTHRKYSIEEARDLINRHLLSRKFTLVVEGEVMHLVEMEKLDPSMLQHVPPLDLDSHLPSTVVKTTFDLPQDLLAEQAVEDVKQLLSEHGKTKVQALKATNRIFAIDSVANLLDVRRMITAERQELEGHTVPRTFMLRHARATDVVLTLKELLGMESGGPQMPMNPQQMQQMMQQMQQQAQQQQQQPGGGGAKQEEKIYLVAVPRHNVILANAPPDKMEIIATTIDVLDVETLEGESLLGQMHRMRPYRLVSLDPELLVTTLQEIGNLDARTRLQADKKTRSILAYATLADHVTIQALIDRLDGTGRDFHVIRLRRLPALQVAGTIATLMGVDKKEEEDSSRRRNYYSFWYGQQQEETGPKDSFRIEADIERNRLMMWANDTELEEIESFLVKMGEIPTSAGPQTVRAMDASNNPETDELIRRLQRLWSGQNELIIQDNRPAEDEAQGSSGAPGSNQATPSEDRQTGNDRARRNVVQFAQLADPPADAQEGSAGDDPDRATGGGAGEADVRQIPGDWPFAEQQPRQSVPREAPPVTITVTPDGRVLLHSDDPAALNRLEDLILELSPPPRDFHVFQIKHADAFWVAYDLKDFFAEEMADEEDTTRRYPYYYYSYYDDSSDQDSSNLLSQQRKLTFVANTDVNAVIVRGASPEQLRTIEELIRVFDRATQEENASARMTEIVHLQYSSAQVVADAIKEAYRDLLSSKDTAFQNQQQQQNGEREGREELVRIYDYGMNNDETKKPTPVKVSFEGALSIGVDSLSNTLIISAQEELIKVIVKIAQELDRQAMPTTTVRTYKVRNADIGALKEMLSRTVSDPWTGGKRPQQPGQGEQPQPDAEQPQQPGVEGQQPVQQAGNGRGTGTTTASQ